VLWLASVVPVACRLPGCPWCVGWSASVFALAVGRPWAAPGGRMRLFAPPPGPLPSCSGLLPSALVSAPWSVAPLPASGLWPGLGLAPPSLAWCRVRVPRWCVPRLPLAVAGVGAARAPGLLWPSLLAWACRSWSSGAGLAPPFSPPPGVAGSPSPGAPGGASPKRPRAQAGRSAFRPCPMSPAGLEYSPLGGRPWRARGGGLSARSKTPSGRDLRRGTGARAQAGRSAFRPCPMSPAGLEYSPLGGRPWRAREDRRL